MANRNDYPIYPPFNPLDKRHLGESAANALLESEVFPLPPEPFIGAGVYALRSEERRVGKECRL